MSADEIKVVAEKPVITIVRKLLKVQMAGLKPVFQDGCIVLADDFGNEYLLKAKTQ